MVMMLVIMVRLVKVVVVMMVMMLVIMVRLVKVVVVMMVMMLVIMVRLVKVVMKVTSGGDDGNDAGDNG